MSAQTLRAASALMRVRAETAQPRAPWRHETERVPVNIANPDGSTYVRQAVYGFDSWQKGDTPFVAEANFQTAAEHIASWHPDVALAVADWLEASAANWGVATAVEQAAALAVARAYLDAAA